MTEAEEANATPDGSESESLEGYKLDEMGGTQVGRVAGVVSGAKPGEAEWLVARMGRFGHFCLVPARDAVSVNGRVWVPYTRDQIRRAPRVDPGAPPSDEVREATLAHYGLVPAR